MDGAEEVGGEGGAEQWVRARVRVEYTVRDWSVACIALRSDAVRHWQRFSAEHWSRMPITSRV